MPRDPHIEHFYLKIGGNTAPPELMNAIVSAEVDISFQLPTAFVLCLHSPGGRWLDDASIREGADVEIEAEGANGAVALCKGRISAFEPEFLGGHQRLTLRGYDLSYKLYRGTHRRSYVQMTDSDIAQRIAHEVGLRCTADSTRHVHPYVFQNNQTHMEFLRERSRMLGFELFVRGDTLMFRAPGSASGDPAVRLQWGEDFNEFRTRLSVAEQVDEVVVRGWDPAKKKEIVGRATRGAGAPRIGESHTGGGAANAIWGGASVHVVDHPVADQAQAEHLAQAVLDERTSGFITGEGVCRGNPAIQAGSVVEIGGLDRRFSGKYYVTSCTHRLTREEGYTTRFRVSARSPKSMLEVLRGPLPDLRCWGVYVGVVTNNNDPDGRGRVKVLLPWLDSDAESTWARMAVPMAGNGRGLLLTPEVNDEVLVAFEHGDINLPYVLGGVWNGQDNPPAGPSDVISPDGKVQKLIWKSRTGHTIVLDDSDTQPGITICDKTGKNLLAFDSMKNSLRIEVAGDLQIKATTDIAIETNGRVSIKGTAGVEVEGSPGVVNVKGTTVNIN